MERCGKGTLLHGAYFLGRIIARYFQEYNNTYRWTSWDCYYAQENTSGSDHELLRNAKPNSEMSRVHASVSEMGMLLRRVVCSDIAVTRQGILSRLMNKAEIHQSIPVGTQGTSPPSNGPGAVFDPAMCFPTINKPFERVQ